MTKGIVCFLFLAPWVAYAADSCAKIEVLSDADCSKLKVLYDLSACGAGAEPYHARVRCHAHGSATALLKTEQGVYESHLKWNDGGWDEGKWVATAPVFKKLEKRSPSGNQPQPHSEPKPAPQAASTQTPAQTPAPTPSPEPSSASNSGISIGGYLDTYYSYNFNRPQPVRAISGVATPAQAAIPPGNNQLRLYDIYHNQFALNLAELTFKKTTKEVQVLIDLDFGDEADLNAAAVGTTGNTVDEVSKHLGQAYLTYAPSHLPRMTIDVGKMDTHIGLETPKAKDDWQYSRSSLYSFGLPIWHTGIHVGYALVPDRLSGGVYLYNGWNTIYDTNSAKSVGGQLKWTPSPEWVLVYNYLGGAEQAANNGLRTTLNEVNGTYSPSALLSFATDLLNGVQGDATWRAFTVAAKYQVSPFYSVSPRFEIFRDANGILFGTPQDLYSYTLTNSFALAEGLESRLEFRRDHSDNAQPFLTSGETSSDQTTALISLQFAF